MKTNALKIIKTAYHFVLIQPITKSLAFWDSKRRLNGKKKDLKKCIVELLQN